VDADGRHDIAARLHAAALHLLRVARGEDPAMGLSPARASALSVLVFGGPRTMGELAAVEQVSAPTMTKLIAGLERDGYVRRVAREGDRRVVEIRATARARRVLERGRERRVARVAQLFAAATEEELKVLDAAARLIERSLEGRSELQARRHFARRRRVPDA